MKTVRGIKALSVLAVIGGLCLSAASAQPFYARGDFNGWGTDNPLTQIDSVLWQGAVSGLDPFIYYEYKIATEDWSMSWPGSNGRVYPDASGEILFSFYNQDSWDDGWYPNDRARVGYSDSGQIGWEIMGAFNDWSGPVILLTDQGDGLWTGSYVVPEPGRYEWKFRINDDWSISIGDDFGNSAGNNAVITTQENQEITFELDLPGGRWRTLGGGGSGPDYPIYARGTFNDYDLSTVLTQMDSVLWKGTVSGLDPFIYYEYLLANEPWTISAPGSDGRIYPDANGNITFYFYDQESWNDGWMPDAKRRAGYDDPHAFTWEVMGAFNGWTDPVATMVDQGNGLWTAEFVVEVPGTYEFKFRQEGSWDISIGDDFGNSASNNTVTTSSENETVQLELDLPGGRWRVVSADTCAGQLCGDANCDSSFDGADIDAFFLGLGNPDQWSQTYPNCDLQCVADINGDQSVDGADIDAFFTALGIGSCP